MVHKSIVITLCLVVLIVVIRPFFGLPNSDQTIRSMEVIIGAMLAIVARSVIKDDNDKDGK